MRRAVTARTFTRRTKNTTNARLARIALARATGGSVRRGLIPAVLRARRGSGATEVKSVDVATVSQALTTAGVFTVANIPVEGASFFNRIGRRIRMKSFHLRGYINPSNTNANAVTAVTAGRVMVVYDRQANGAAPTTADLLTAYTSAGATSNLTLDGINMNNRDRFQVLMDMQVSLPPIGINGATAASTAFQSSDVNANAGDAHQGQLVVNRFIKLRGLETHFKASAGAIGDIATGALLVFTIGTDTNGTGAFNLTWTGRLKFFD